MKEKVKQLVEAVPERVIFGSDYSGCSQTAHVQFVKELGLNAEAEAKVLCGNALQAYAL